MDKENVVSNSEGEILFYDGDVVLPTWTAIQSTSTLSVDSLSFGGSGKISGISEIEFSNGTKFTLPIEAGKENQILIYTKDKKLEWKNIYTLRGMGESETKYIIDGFQYFNTQDILRAQEIQQLRKEMKMYKGLQFTDYFTMFVIALFAIWVVKKISWRVVLTPIKKLFKFAEKKAGEVEFELKKAEETWKEID